jgi:biopolymer transport protein ExbD
MKMSRRALRMERHHKRHGGVMSLNIVSVIDIFTILVFFLLVHSADVELPGARIVQLPESTAEKPPRQTAVVVVTDTDIVVQGRRVMGTRDVLANDQQAGIPQLTRALEEWAGRRLRATAEEQDAGEVTIMAAKELPYRLMKKVMVACTEARYGQVSFAVLHKTDKGDGS